MLKDDSLVDGHSSFDGSFLKRCKKQLKRADRCLVTVANNMQIEGCKCVKLKNLSSFLKLTLVLFDVLFFFINIVVLSSSMRNLTLKFSS